MNGDVLTTVGGNVSWEAPAASNASLQNEDILIISEDRSINLDGNMTLYSMALEA